MSSTTETDFDRDALVRWYAKRHFETDPGVEAIHFLPKNAPDREIRFLEVNSLISDTMPLEPIDFGVDRGMNTAHTLFVLDVTPTQWKSILTKQTPLPNGWTLDDSEQIDNRWKT